MKSWDDCDCLNGLSLISDILLKIEFVSRAYDRPSSRRSAEKSSDPGVELALAVSKTAVLSAELMICLKQRDKRQDHVSWWNLKS
jgi:hypothetical protein